MSAPFCPISEQQCVSVVIESIQKGLGGWIVTPNLDHLRRFRSDPGYAALVLEANLRVADGMPLVWASRLQGTPLPARVAGSDLVSTLSRALGKNGMSIYLLGGNPGTAEAAAEVLRERCPGLVIAGTACPASGFEHDPQQVTALRKDLERCEPDVILVGLGSPKQEHLIQRLRSHLPHAWWLGIGISFSFLCGDVKRAPGWMQRWGLEWVHRLAQEPRRLAGRYLVHGVPFAGRLALGALLGRA